MAREIIKAANTIKRIQTAIAAISFIILTGLINGCSLLPYESDFACPYSEGYGRCLGAKENYELSQMSDKERAKALGQSQTKNEAANSCEQVRAECNCNANGECFNYEDLQKLRNSGCLTPAETIALENNEALQYIKRLLLDRRAIDERTPKETETNKTASKTDASQSESGAYCELDNASQSKAESGEVETPNEESENGAIVADALIESVAISAEANGVERKTTDGSKLCGFPQVDSGATIRIEVDRAWLRQEPNPKYPPSNAIEAKRGDRFIVAEGWQTEACGWLKLENNRYIHQSIVSVIKENANEEN
jgi:hypothetical protein